MLPTKAQMYIITLTKEKLVVPEPIRTPVIIDSIL